MKAATSAAKAPAMTGTTTTADEADEEAEAIDHTNEEDLDNVDDEQEGFEEEDNNVKRYNDEGTTPAVNSERNSFVSSDDLSLSEDDTKVKLNGLLTKGFIVLKSMVLILKKKLRNKNFKFFSDF